MSRSGRFSCPDYKDDYKVAQGKFQPHRRAARIVLLAYPPVGGMPGWLPVTTAPYQDGVAVRPSPGGLMTRLSLTRLQVEFPAGAELLAICQSITDDGLITDDELSRLRQWLLQNHHANLPAGRICSPLRTRSSPTGRLAIWNAASCRRPGAYAG
jgi:hypothetical protein